MAPSQSKFPQPRSGGAEDSPEEMLELREETDCPLRKKPYIQNASGGPMLGCTTPERGSG